MQSWSHCNPKGKKYYLYDFFCSTNLSKYKILAVEAFHGKYTEVHCLFKIYTLDSRLKIEDKSMSFE